MSGGDNKEHGDKLVLFLLILQINDYPTLLFYPSGDKSNPVTIMTHLYRLFLFLAFYFLLPEIH